MGGAGDPASLGALPRRARAHPPPLPHAHPIHHDRDFARAAGHEDIFINTAFIRGCLCRVLTDWIGLDGFVKSLGFQMRKPNLVGETIAVRGRVRKRGPDGRVDLEVWIENAKDGITVPGDATVILPRRA